MRNLWILSLSRAMLSGSSQWIHIRLKSIRMFDAIKRKFCLFGSFWIYCNNTSHHPPSWRRHQWEAAFGGVHHGVDSMVRSIVQYIDPIPTNSSSTRIYDWWLLLCLNIARHTIKHLYFRIYIACLCPDSQSSTVHASRQLFNFPNHPALWTIILSHNKSGYYAYRSIQ